MHWSVAPDALPGSAASGPLVVYAHYKVQKITQLHSGAWCLAHHVTLFALL